MRSPQPFAWDFALWISDFPSWVLTFIGLRPSEFAVRCWISEAVAEFQVR